MWVNSVLFFPPLTSSTLCQALLLLPIFLKCFCLFPLSSQVVISSSQKATVEFQKPLCSPDPNLPGTLYSRLQSPSVSKPLRSGPRISLISCTFQLLKLVPSDLPSASGVYVFVSPPDLCVLFLFLGGTSSFLSPDSWRTTCPDVPSLSNVRSQRDSLINVYKTLHTLTYISGFIVTLKPAFHILTSGHSAHHWNGVPHTQGCGFYLIESAWCLIHNEHRLCEYFCKWAIQISPPASQQFQAPSPPWSKKAAAAPPITCSCATFRNRNQWAQVLPHKHFSINRRQISFLELIPLQAWLPFTLYWLELGQGLSLSTRELGMYLIS